MVRRGGGILSNSFKVGLGAGVGFGLSSILFLLVGMAFFVPGLIMLSKERKASPQEKNTTNLYIAYALMIIGSIIGLGLGASFIFENIFSDF